MGLWQNLTTLIVGEPANASRGKVNFRRLTARDLIRAESKIGAKLFGPIPKGHRREFFCLDEHTWVWYEEWLDAETKKKRSVTTRYEVHENGIIKVQDGQPYQVVEGEELHNLITAIQLYYEQVVRGIYHYDPATGQPLPHHPAFNKSTL
jgi:hypothetical protein